MKRFLMAISTILLFLSSLGWAQPATSVSADSAGQAKLVRVRAHGRRHHPHRAKRHRHHRAHA